jgi:hypothetical protein
MLWLMMLLSARADDDDGTPSFGGDASVGIVGGLLLNDWVSRPAHGLVLGRYDAFISSREQPGPRLGLSVWGSTTVWPLPERTEEDIQSSFSYTQYGLMTVLRADPELPVGWVGGLGFGRLDLPDWYAGPNYLPTATLEAGLRQRLGDRPFIDYLLRAHWAQARDASNLGFEEWWMVQLAVTLGVHIE